MIEPLCYEALQYPTPCHLKDRHLMQLQKVKEDTQALNVEHASHQVTRLLHVNCLQVCPMSHTSQVYNVIVIFFRSSRKLN